MRIIEGFDQLPEINAKLKYRGEVKNKRDIDEVQKLLEECGSNIRVRIVKYVLPENLKEVENFRNGRLNLKELNVAGYEFPGIVFYNSNVSIELGISQSSDFFPVFKFEKYETNRDIESLISKGKNPRQYIVNKGEEIVIPKLCKISFDGSYLIGPNNLQ